MGGPKKRQPGNPIWGETGKPKKGGPTEREKMLGNPIWGDPRNDNWETQERETHSKGKICWETLERGILQNKVQEVLQREPCLDPPKLE
jgi:hypothetical protein